MIMLAHKKNHGLVKNANIVEASFFGTLPFEMNNGTSCKIMVPESGLQHPVAKVNILAIHEKHFIEATCDVQHFFGHHHESACKHFHFMRFMRVQLSKVITAKNF